jgi:hypothetical protein
VSRLARLAAAGVLAAAAAFGAEPPPALSDARVEILEGSSPRAALARAADGDWLAWSVPALAGAEQLCCWNGGRARGCSLGREPNGWGNSSDAPAPARPGELIVFARVERHAVTALRAMARGCPVDGAGRQVLWLGAVAPEASLELLTGLVERGGELGETALAAVAHHAGAGADALLERRALDRSLAGEAREQALFWAGNARGEAGYRLVCRVLDSEPDEELRQHALFALTQSPVPGALDRLRRAGVEDASVEVRGQALFWLAQSGAPGAGDWILGRLDAESDEEVRRQAVFALSQLDDGTDRLLAVLRSKRDPETIRQALFWLGQSDDPRALAELERILD